MRPTFVQAVCVQKFESELAVNSYKNRLAFLNGLSYLEVEKKETEYREYPQRAWQEPRLCVRSHGRSA